MVDFTLTDEQKDIRQLAHDFAEKEIRPKAAEYVSAILEAFGRLSTLVDDVLALDRLAAARSWASSASGWPGCSR